MSEKLFVTSSEIYIFQSKVINLDWIEKYILVNYISFLPLYLKKQSDFFK